MSVLQHAMEIDTFLGQRDDATTLVEQRHKQTVRKLNFAAV